MTREEARKAAEVMLAYANGEEIETCYPNSLYEKEWYSTTIPAFDFQTKEYRIKPKPKFDPKTLQPFDKVLVRDTGNECWNCNFFSHILDGREFPYMCSSSYKIVIPYNDETKHLVGTSDDAPEFYRYWEE